MKKRLKDDLINTLEEQKESISVEKLEQFPDINYRSDRDKVIMAATVMGLSQPCIANAFGISQPMVNKIINRLDPLKMYRRDKDAKKALLADLALQSAANAVRYITEEKMQEASAKDLVYMQKQWISMGQELMQSKHREAIPSRLDDIVDELAEATEVSVEEEEGAEEEE